MPRDRSHHKSPYREAADGGRRRCSIRHLNHVAFSLVMNVDDLVVAAAIECFAIAAPDRGLGALRSVPCGLDLASGPNPSLLNPFLRLFEQPRPTSRSMGSRTRWLGTRPSANVNPHATSRRWVGYTASSLAKGPYPHLSAAEGAFGAEGSWAHGAEEPDKPGSRVFPLEGVFKVHILIHPTRLLGSPENSAHRNPERKWPVPGNNHVCPVGQSYWSGLSSARPKVDNGTLLESSVHVPVVGALLGRDPDQTFQPAIFDRGNSRGTYQGRDGLPLRWQTPVSKRGRTSVMVLSTTSR